MTNDEYTHLQKMWLNATGVKEGSWVKVLRAVKNHESGWGNSWAPEMIPVTELLRAYNSRNSYRLNNDVAMLYTDFKNATSTVAAFICGHNHIDDSNQEGGLLVISTVGDSLYQEPNAPERKKDTLSEHGFDIFVVDKDSRSLSAIRIGAGESREWEY